MLDLSEISKHLESAELSADFCQEVLVSSRQLSWCETVGNDCRLLQKIVNSFNSSINPFNDLLKAIINIAYQVPSTKAIIATFFSESRPLMINSLQIYSEESFLFTRLFFILAADEEACNILCEKCLWMEDSVLEPTISLFSAEINEKGIESVLDALTLRYIQTSRAKIDHEVVRNQVSTLLKKCPQEKIFCSVIGASYHVLSAVCPHNKPYQYIDCQILSQSLKIVLENKSSPDYRTLLLNVAYFMCRDDDTTRKVMRHDILPSPSKTPLIDLELWKELLSHPDSHISVSSGELLFLLCKQKVSRLLAHLGFGPCAGFLHMKGLLQSQQSSSNGLDDLELSSDEEYYSQHPVKEDNHDIPVPETYEEIKEYEMLMTKISEFNAKSFKK